VSPARLVHHELCFGCGRTNLFGLLIELEETDEGRVRGRGFVKQDHQGPVPGSAHPGIVAAALSEAIAFAAGDDMDLATLQIELEAPVPVGVFLEVEARAGTELESTATAWVSERQVASASATYRRG
jgi:acyl-coenzyme A thioesterase PaaI-like protein